MEKLRLKYKTCYKDKRFLFLVFFAILFLVSSLIIHEYAVLFATKKASNHVDDIVLSNIPALNLNFIFIYGPILIWSVVVAICFFEPQKIPFVLKSIALFVLIRSLFVVLTHIGIFPNSYQFTNNDNFMKRFSDGYDLFFSGHTGTPFLMALIFWEEKIYRYYFIFLSVFFGIIVLLGHYHYSIDVLGAFFITYTIYHIAEIIFKKERKIFNG